MKVAYVDCSSGAAGDMLLGALIDAGAPEQNVRNALDALNLDGWALHIEGVLRRGIAATNVSVTVAQEQSRSYADIVRLLSDAALDERTRQLALAVFEHLAKAEATVHGTVSKDVHFHEVGATDAIVDVVGCSAAITALELDRVVVSPIATGTGTVTSAHGEFPLPAPAVAEILRNSGATIFGRGHNELITPTGAAILATVADDFASLPPIRIEKVGQGAGDADLEWPNVVRILIGQLDKRADEPGGALLLEANIDDMSPELVPHAIDKLLVAGAHDAWVTSIVMKKGRPAFKLSALCSTELEATIVDVFFRETTTLGLRTSPVDRHILEREWIHTRIDGESVRVKIGRSNGVVTTIAPEHDDALQAAANLSLPLKTVYARSAEEAGRMVGKESS